MRKFIGDDIRVDTTINFYAFPFRLKF